jgi:hypothetical protein
VVMHVLMLRQAGRMLPRRSHPRQAATAKASRCQDCALRQLWQSWED